MKKILVVLSCLMAFSAMLFAQDVPANQTQTQSQSFEAPVIDDDAFEEGKTKTEVITVTNTHSGDTTATVRIEYLPIYDEVRIYYESMYVTYDRGEAMNAVLQCLADFQAEHKYFSYRYLRNDKERFFKDDKGRRKAQYMSYVKFSR